MRFLRASFHLSARAARRARASGALKASIPAFVETPSQRFLANLHRQGASLHTGAPAPNLLDTSKTTEDAAEASAGAPLPLGTVEDTEDSEKENSHRHRNVEPPEPIPVEQIDETVRAVVEQTVECNGEDAWKNVDLASPSLKFKIVSGAMEACRSPISSLHLTNIASVRDLLEVLHCRRRSHIHDPFSHVDTVEEMFKEKAAELPPNMYFHPSSHRTRNKSAA
ncbi:hypothetical protein DFJ77DRAFT_19547 [Powellomyces hirtus]|nr:hypothetical protein DFJ77DRAFT_19547 [Powellomyces hirtus]